MGLDLGDRYTHFCILTDDGEIEAEGRVRSTPTAVRRRFGKLAAMRVALEVGSHSPWMQRTLEAAGHEVLVANARKLRMIYQADSKTDRLDAERLARVARVDTRLLAPIRHRSRQAAVDLALLRARDGLVRTRTSLVNQVRGTVKPFGTRIRSGGAPNFHKTAPAQIPEALQPALTPAVKLLEQITAEIRALDARIALVAKRSYPDAVRLQQIPGVGPITALRYVLTLEDPHRFPKSRAVGAYLGLRPRKRQSGERDTSLRITKAGDRELRRLLVQCAQYLLGQFGPDCYLRRHGLALAARGGKSSKKQAVVAIARKLAVLMHRLWISGEDYDAFRNAEPQAREPKSA